MSTDKLMCPCCHYSENSANAKKCELCGTSLQPISTNRSVSPIKELDFSSERQKSSTPKPAVSSTKAKGITQKYLKFILLGLAIGLAMGTGGSLILIERNKSTLKTQQVNKSAVDNDSKPKSALRQQTDKKQRSFV